MPASRASPKAGGGRRGAQALLWRRPPPGLANRLIFGHRLRRRGLGLLGQSRFPCIEIGLRFAAPLHRAHRRLNLGHLLGKGGGDLVG